MVNEPVYSANNITKHLNLKYSIKIINIKQFHKLLVKNVTDVIYKTIVYSLVVSSKRFPVKEFE